MGSAPRVRGASGVYTTRIVLGIFSIRGESLQNIMIDMIGEKWRFRVEYMSGARGVLPGALEHICAPPHRSNLEQPVAELKKM